MNAPLTNKEVARQFNLLGQLLELHGENPFKTRSYSSAYVIIRKLSVPVVEQSREELLEIQGIGKAIADKIIELRETGEINTLSRYIQNTPPGVVQMLQMKGFGPKKIRIIWEQMGIETPGELLYACEENRLIDLKGFGAKTQQNLKEQLEYFLASQGKYLMGHIEEVAHELLKLLRQEFEGEGRFDLINGIRRMNPVVDGIELLSDIPEHELIEYLVSEDLVDPDEENLDYKGVNVLLSYCEADEYDHQLWQGSGSPEFLAHWDKLYGPVSSADKELFSQHGLDYIPPELRENPDLIDQVKAGSKIELIAQSDIKGVVHSHSTYSDGTASIAEMAQASKDLGYEYLVMSDHSKAAFYANGLNEEKVLEQIDEIDKLNGELSDFRVFKSIECDILYDGQLDYDDEFLKNFELVIASVHSNLKMTEEKAMHRLLTAIAHPAVSILGHPTGRLLLSREGYPVDHKVLIDACAKHNVAIEINASPYRLDIDWTWIEYAQSQGVLLSINPDAHSTEGIKDIKYGVYAARKGGLRPENCLNTMSVQDFEAWIYTKMSC